MSAQPPPSAFQMERTMSAAQRALDMLRNDAGQVFDDADAIFAALSEEGIDAKGLIRAIAIHALDAKANKAAAAAKATRYTDLKAREARFGKQYTSYRAVISMAMRALVPPDNEGVRKVLDPEFTLRLPPPSPPDLEIDPDKLPDEYVDIEIVPATTKRVPKMDKVRDALDRRIEVAGVVLVPAESVLTIRSK